MKNYQSPPNPQTVLRDAFGPGFQAGGPSDALLRAIGQQPKRTHI